MGRLARSRARSPCRAPQSAKSRIGVFFLIAFSFAAAMAKEKAGWQKSFVLAVDGTWILYGRGEHCSPAKYHKVTFPLSYFCMTKSTKSQQRECSPLFANSSRVHELVARAMRGERVRQRIKQKSVVLLSPQSPTYHACEHITRKNRADSCTHCLHAR